MAHEPAYRFALPAYRQLRRLKNRIRNLLDPPVVVLAYHRVAVKPLDPHQVAVSPENFRAQMVYLKRMFRLVRFEEDWRGLRAPAVAVTFDDGYADNLTAALPIIEDIGVPAAFFISTFMLGVPAGYPPLRGFWCDELERLLLRNGNHPPSLYLEDSHRRRCWSTVTDAERRALHDELHFEMQKIGPTRREECLCQLRKWAESDGGADETDRPLTRSELEALASSPLVTIGAHTISHTPLAVLSEEEQKVEILTSKRQLEEVLGRDIGIFAYPYGGRGHYDRISVRLCREAGFRRAVSTFPGQAHRWTDPLQIPRQLVRNWDADTFAAKLESFWT